MVRSMISAVRPYSIWMAIPIAVAAGIIYNLAFPRFSIWPLAFIGIGLFLLTLIGRTVWSALLLGYLFGVTFYLTNVSWTGRYLGPLPWLALSLFEATIVAGGAVLITLGYRWFARWSNSSSAKSLLLPILIAGIWILREQVTGSFPYGGFPWARAALSQSESPFAELVSWVGNSGMGLIMVFITASVLEWLRVRPRVTFLIPATLVSVGALLVPCFPTTTQSSFRVGAVQGNGPAGYFDQQAPGQVFNAQVAATQAILSEKLDVLIWPEGSVDTPPVPGSTTAANLNAITKQLSAPLLINTVTERDGKYFNTSLLWDDTGANQSYDKRHPVPFGEYIPDRDFYMLLAPDLIGLVQRGYTAGSNAPLFRIGQAKIGLATCFDVIYDDLIYESTRSGAELYVFQTNNADFRGTDENLQQLASARMRAIETGRWVVNISTVGTSQIIDPQGQTRQTIATNTIGTMVSQVELRTGLTPAVIAGDTIGLSIAFGSVAGLVLLFVVTRFSARRRGAPVSN